MPDPLHDQREVRIDDIQGLRELTWFSSEPLGHYSSLGTISGGSISILAGFTLASGVALATASTLETLESIVIGIFALASASLFVSLALVSEATAYFSTPADRLEWFPESKVSRSLLADQRQRQRDDFLRYDAFRRRALQWYAVGAALALSALALLLLAQVDGSALQLSYSNDTLLDASAFLGSAALLGAALFVLSFAPFEILLPLAQRRDRRVLSKARRLWPNLDSVSSTPLTDAGTLRDWPPPE